jgi:hypothetical protein
VYTCSAVYKTARTIGNLDNNLIVELRCDSVPKI